MYLLCELLLFAFVLWPSILVYSNFDNVTDLYIKARRLLKEFETYQLPTDNSKYFENYSSGPTILLGTFDFVIVGGGAAGLVLANRLTETSFEVLVIEAGPVDPDITAILGLNQYCEYTPLNWGYNTTKQRYACLGSINHQCIYPRGKGVGGSSLINAGMYVRGNRKDYDKWEELGNKGWSYKDVLKYFKKSENANFTVDIDKDFHGFNGPQSVGLTQDVDGWTTGILDGFKELGLKELDYNGKYQLGYSRMQFYTTYNVRSSSNYSFLRPAANRKNLRLMENSLATKIVIENNRTKGVEFVHQGKTYYAKSSKEVIVSSGTINSPQILMLSGIGPAEELKKHGIGVIADLPVGKNLVDHVMCDAVTYRTSYPQKNYSLEAQIKLWTENKRPLTAGIGAQVISFFDFNNDGIPDVEIFVAAASKLNGNLLNRASPEYLKGFEDINELTDFTVFVMLLHPSSIGEITLESNDPRKFPLINTNYLSRKSDVKVIYKGIQKALELNNTLAFQKIRAKLRVMPVPGCDHEKYGRRMTKKWWYCAIRHLVVTVFHPVGTTRMGTLPSNSVVNSNLSVHGVRGLRVVDAGVVPFQISGHTNAVSVMIAEKAADLIKNEHGINC